MTHKLIKTDNYILVVDDSVHPYDSSKVGNPLAHLPLNGSPILEGVDLLPPIEDDEDLIEDALSDLPKNLNKTSVYGLGFIDGRISGYQKAREKYKYTEDDVWKAIVISKSPNEYGDYLTINDIIQSLHQYPTEFECEMEWVRDKPYDEVYKVPKIITTAQGVQWVGKYK